MRTVKSDSNGLAQVSTLAAATLTRGGIGNKTATFTSTLPHRLATGNRVRVVGADLPYFNTESNGSVNSTVAVTVTSATAFTYLMADDPGGNANVANVTAQRALESYNYDPFALISPEGYLLTAPQGIEVAENEILLALDGTVQTFTADLSIFFRKAWIYPIKSFDGNGIPTANVNNMNVGKSTKLPDLVKPTDGPIIYQFPDGEKMKLAALHVKGVNTDSAFLQYS